MKKILLTSVCKPIGPCVGDATSVGYELLHGQVTRSQHIYSPRVIHKQFSLDYIAENLDTPAVVMHYPSKAAFLKEIKKGYDLIGIAFVLSTHHHMLDMCRLIREHSPKTKIILGGYGTVMSDEELNPYCDAICRGEGVGFMRRYLGEKELAVNAYKHPEITSRLRIFGIPVAHTAMIFAGLGCPNGCDFCCTSHFFKRKHIRLLPTGESIFETMAQHQKRDSHIEYTILDEDFLLNRKRAGAFLDSCRKKERTFSTFCFASVKALSQFSYDELLEMGVDGVWVGYEGKKSGYSKHHGKNIDQLIRELQDHGITVLSSMIVGIPYQTEEIARREFAGLMADKPALNQFLIYGPTPGTPFYEKVLSSGSLNDELLNDRTKYYKQCSGFTAMVKHPFMQPSKIEALQEEFYNQDFKLLGPSIFRIARVKLNGYKKYKDSNNPLLRKKAVAFRAKLAKFLAILPVGMLGPKISLKNRISYIKQYFEILRNVNIKEKMYVFAAPIMIMAAMASLFVRWFGWMEHPITRHHHYFGRNSFQKPVKFIGSLWNYLHIRGDTTCITFWRKLSWSALMSLRVSPRILVPKMDVLEDWIRGKKLKLFRKGIGTEKLDGLRSQIQALQIKFIDFKKEYQILRKEFKSTSYAKIKELKRELKATRRELKIRIRAMRYNIYLLQRSPAFT